MTMSSAPARRPLFYVLVGLPGTGKTRFRTSMTTNVPFRRWRVVSIDDHIERFAKEAGKPYDAVWREAVNDAMAKAMGDLRDGIEKRLDIIVDATNMTVGSRARKLAGLPAEYIKYAVVFPEPDTATYAQRLARPGKSISAADIQRMRDSFVYPSKSEGFDEVVESTE